MTSIFADRQQKHSSLKKQYADQYLKYYIKSKQQWAKDREGERYEWKKKKRGQGYRENYLGNKEGA